MDNATVPNDWVGFAQMPISETWSGTGRIVLCVRNAYDKGYIAREMVRTETGERRYEPLEIVLVDTFGRPPQTPGK